MNTMQNILMEYEQEYKTSSRKERRQGPMSSSKKPVKPSEHKGKQWVRTNNKRSVYE